jgi:hypothetical protein
MRPSRAAVALALLALAAPVAATAHAEAKLVTAAPNKGLIAVAVGVVHKPVGALTVHLVATPAQRVKVDWSLTCELRLVGGGYPAPTRIGEGTFTATAPFTHALALPAPHPAVCSLSVYGILTHKGHEVVAIYEG